MQRIHIHSVFERVDLTSHRLRRVLEQISLSRHHGVRAHPHDCCVKRIADFGNIARPNDHIATRTIHFILKYYCDRLRTERFFQIAILRNDTFDFTCPLGGKDHDLIPLTNNA